MAGEAVMEVTTDTPGSRGWSPEVAEARSRAFTSKSRVERGANRHGLKGPQMKGYVKSLQ